MKTVWGFKNRSERNSEFSCFRFDCSCSEEKVSHLRLPLLGILAGGLDLTTLPALLDGEGDWDWVRERDRERGLLLVRGLALWDGDVVPPAAEVEGKAVAAAEVEGKGVAAAEVEGKAVAAPSLVGPL